MAFVEALERGVATLDDGLSFFRGQGASTAGCHASCGDYTRRRLERRCYNRRVWLERN